MTSSVRVKAICSESMFVQVMLTDINPTGDGEPQEIEEVLMNNGEEIEWLVHDNRCLHVREIPKPVEEAEVPGEGEGEPVKADGLILPPAA